MNKEPLFIINVKVNSGGKDCILPNSNREDTAEKPKTEPKRIDFDENIISTK